jgi:hypothetical protein
MNNILIVDITDSLVHYEKIEHEILGSEFLYVSKNLLDDFTQLPQADKKVAVFRADYVADRFDISIVPAVDLSMFDLLIIMDEEPLQGTTPEEYLAMTRDRFSIDNVIIVAGAVDQTVTLTTDKIFVFPLSLIEVSCDYSYKENTTTKLKLFDALLGTNRYHRVVIFEKLCSSGLLDKSYVSMIDKNFDNGNVSTIYYSPELQELELAEAAQAKERNSGVFHSYEGTFSCDPWLRSRPKLRLQFSISRQIPSKIYQNSYYSIVAETEFQKYIFFTEKTVKPLLAKRLFVMFSAYHQLKTLQEYGFKTFGSIIDESYDNEVRDDLRYDMAFDQCIALSKMNPIWVQGKIKHILEHNHSLMTDRARLIAPLRAWLLHHIKTSC